MQKPSRKLLVVLIGLLVLGFVVYRSSGMLRHSEFSGIEMLRAVRSANPYYLILSLVTIYLCYALRSLRWKVFQQNLGPSSFWNIYKMTLAGFSALQLLGRPGEPVRPVLLARKEKLPVSGMFGVYLLERIFDFASMAVIAIVALLRFRVDSQSGETARALEKAAKPAASLLFLGILGATSLLVYLRFHGTALLERQLQVWLQAHGWRAKVAGIVMEFARGVQTIRSWRDLALAVLYSAVHWFLVLVVYFWVAKSFGGTLSTLSLSDAMLVLAVTLVGSVLQLPGVGGGSQAVSTIAYSRIFLVKTEAALAASIVLWLITFAACSLAGVPLLIHEGLSLGRLRELAEHEKEAAIESAAQQGDSAQ
jgi:glycosyltransferase 2 family protein